MMRFKCEKCLLDRKQAPETGPGLPEKSENNMGCTHHQVIFVSIESLEDADSRDPMQPAQP
jgi:hypothetical protein